MEIDGVGHQTAKTKLVMRPRRTWNVIRIDMTPFVSIALLLMVFFAWLKTIQQPTIMSGNMVTGCRKGIEPERSAHELTILLLGHDTIQFCYHSVGSRCFANFVTAHSRSTKLRQALRQHRRAALTPGELAIVIRPTAASTVGNFAAILNELRMAGDLPYLIHLR